MFATPGRFFESRARRSNASASGAETPDAPSFGQHACKFHKLGRDRPGPPSDLRKRRTRDHIVLPADQYAELAVVQSVDRADAEPGRKHAIERGRRRAAH